VSAHLPESPLRNQQSPLVSRISSGLSNLLRSLKSPPVSQISSGLSNLLRSLKSPQVPYIHPPLPLSRALVSPIGQETSFDSLSAPHWTGARWSGSSHPSGRSLQQGSFVAPPTASSRLVEGRRVVTPRTPPSPHRTSFCTCALAFLSFAKSGGKPRDWPGGRSKCR